MKKIILFVFAVMIAGTVRAQTFDFECARFTSFEHENVFLTLEHGETAITATISVSVETPEIKWLPRKFVVNIDKFDEISGLWELAFRLRSTENYGTSHVFNNVLTDGRYRYTLLLVYKHPVTNLGLRVARLNNVEFTIINPPLISNVKLVANHPSPDMAIEFETSKKVTSAMGGVRGNLEPLEEIDDDPVRYDIQVTDHSINNRTYDFYSNIREVQSKIRSLKLLRIKNVEDIEISDNKIHIILKKTPQEDQYFTDYINDENRPDTHIGTGDLKGRLEKIVGTDVLLAFTITFTERPDILKIQNDLEAGIPVYAWFTN